jgi:N-acetylneuraminic acid mutarotase
MRKPARHALIVALAAVALSGCLTRKSESAALLLSAPLAARREPSPRSLHSAFYDGEGMIVWGGMLDDRSVPSATGGAIYYPGSGKWYELPKHRHESRYHHAAVWTGIQLIVWGGIEGLHGERVNTGLMLDNEDDEWLDVSTEGAPAPRSGHAAVWTGKRMLVWGGEGAEKTFGDGASYDLVKDKWEALADADAPAPRAFPSAVWTGKKMIVWGGLDAKGPRRDGAIYDPAANSWSSISLKGAPKARLGHTAIWTGKRMIVWGGRGADDEFFGDGAIYEPEKDVWTPLPASGLAPRELHTATWTGHEMVIFGGQDEDGPQPVNGIYDPKTRKWRTFRLAKSMPARYMHTAVWDGKSLIVFGGRGEGGGPLRDKVAIVVSLEKGKAPVVVKESED